MKNFIAIGKTEDEQADQIKKWLKDNGLQIFAGIGLGLGGIWGVDYYQVYQNNQAVEARLSYLSVVASPNNTQALTTLQTQHADSGYAQQATLMKAKYAVNQGNYAQAIDDLSALLNSENEFIAHTARLRSSAIYLEMRNFDQALSILDNNKNSAFSNLYHQAKGDIYVAQGKMDAAQQQYQLAIDKLPEDSTLRRLIHIKLNDLN